MAFFDPDLFPVQPDDDVPTADPVPTPPIAAASSVVSAISGFLRQTASSVISGINNSLDSTTSLINGVANKIEGSLDRAIGRVQRSIDSVQANVVTSIIDALNPIRQEIVDTADGIIAGLGASLNSTADRLGGLFGQVEAQLDGVLESVGEQLNSVRKSVETTITSGIGEVGDAITNTTNIVVGAMGAAIIQSQSALLELFAQGQSLVLDALLKGQDLLAAGIGKVAAEAGKGLLNFFGSTINEEEPELLAKVEPLLNMLKESRNLPPQLRALASLNPSAPHFYQFLLGLIAGAGVLQATTLASLAGPLSTLTHDSLASNTPERPPLLDAIRMLHGGVIGRDAYHTWLRREGIDEGDADRLALLHQYQANPVDLISLQRRNIISLEDVDAVFQSQGIHPYDRVILHRATEVIPGVQDVIRFAVKEVYDPEQRQSLSLDEDYPALFTGKAGALGIPEADAKDHWAAHWDLPSPTQVFEMLHRGIITQEQVNNYLKAADYAPIWRPRMSAISFNPLTRVDVRRMYDIDVLAEADVTKAYKDLGYTEENALLLTRFVVALKEKREERENKEGKDLTRSDVIGAYEDGLIDSGPTKALILEMGYDERETDIILARSDFKQSRDSRKTSIDAVLSKFKAAQFTYEQAVDSLGKLDLATPEHNKALNQLTRLLEVKDKRPTIDQLNKMAEFKLITPQEYGEELEHQGYAERWVINYTKLAFAEKKSGRK